MGDTAELYQALIMDRARTPRFAGRPAAFDVQAAGDNPICGDRTQVYLGFENGRVAVVGHESRGCAIMTASADLMAEAVRGADAARIARLRSAFEAIVTTGVPDPSLGELNALAGVFEFRSRIRCATLPWSALSEALVKEHADG